jgi:protoheme IX farnesyltransferase
MLSLADVTYLALTVGVLASLIALIAFTGYLLFYTPLKRVTPICTFVGAAPRAGCR